MIKQKCGQAKIKWPKIFFSVNLQYLSFDFLGSGVSTTFWLKCSVGINLNWFCHAYKLSSLPAKQRKHYVTLR